MTQYTIPTSDPTSGVSGFPQPASYLGEFVGYDPSNPSTGQWWYRLDLGRARQYINGNIVDVSTEDVILVAGSETIGGSNIDVTQDIVVIQSSTLQLYGSVNFIGKPNIFGSLVSSNPNASSTNIVSNIYNFYQNNLYINGSYNIAQYNIDTLLTSSGTLSIISPTSYSPTIIASGSLQLNIFTTINGNFTLIGNVIGSGTLNIPSGYTLIAQNLTLGISNVIGSGTLNIPSGYTLTAQNLTLGTNVIGSGTLNIPSGYTLTAQNLTLGVSNLVLSGTLNVPSGYTLTTTVPYSFSSPNFVWSGTLNSQSYIVYYAPSGAVNISPNSNIVELVATSFTSTQYFSGTIAGNVVLIGSDYNITNFINQGATSPIALSLTYLTNNATLVIGGNSVPYQYKPTKTIGTVSFTLTPGAYYNTGYSGSGIAIVITSISVSGPGIVSLNTYNTGAQYNYRAFLFVQSTTNISITLPYSITLAQTYYAGPGSISIYNNSSLTIAISGTLYGW